MPLFLFQFEGDEKALCEQLMLNCSLICRIVNSTFTVDMDKFEKLCKDTYELALKVFPWCNIVPSLHRSWAHIFKKMRKMGNKGLVRKLANLWKSICTTCKAFLEKYSHFRDNLVKHP